MLHSEFMVVILDEFSVQYTSENFIIHSQQIKELVSKFESDQQDIISKKQKKLIESINQNHI